MSKRERGTGGLFRMKGSRFWYGQFTGADGKVRRKTTGKDIKAEAQAVLREWMTDNARGITFVGDVQKITYGDLRESLINNYVSRGNKSLLVDGQGEPFINGLKALDEFFKYEGPDKPGVTVDRITTDAAASFANRRLAQGVTASTVNNSLALLRRMLNIAREDRKIRFVPTIRLLKPNSARKGFLPREKFDQLLAALPEHVRPLILCLYWTGVRKGEAEQIQWSQVDLQSATIRLEDEQTKSGEARTLPLPDVLVEVLEKMPEKRGQVFDSTNLRKAWMKACTSVGLGTLGEPDEQGNQKYQGLLVHDLRRSAIRNLMKAGVSENVAMAISGHKTRAVFDRYHIVDTEDVVNAMRKAEAVSESSVRRAVPTRRQKQLTR